MIDRLRKELQERLDQLVAEADKLRNVLAALDPRAGPSSPQPAQPPRPPATAQRARRASPRRRRTPPGATKTQVLRALADGKAMTAAEVAAATGLPPGTISTTLSRLAKNGDVLKAQRGYQLPASDRSAPEGADGA